MSLSPLTQSCPHIATLEEQERDPGYLACNAEAGQPCLWAKGHDGVVPPPFHSERLEALAMAGSALKTQDAARFRKAVLESGLV